MKQPGADETGQASVDLLAVLPAVLVLALVVFQLLAVGYSEVLAGDAAEAGALALAGGADARDAARRALPGWSRAHMQVEVGRGRVRVRLRPPSPIPAVARKLQVEAAAAAGVR
jgi:pilus assembly protein CpaE